MRTFLILIILAVSIQAQSLIKDDAVLKAIWKEANENSQLKQLAHELLDVVGPRLSGTPQMLKANDWAVSKYKSWGISARNEKMGEWLGWERGVTHIDLLEPRVRTLEGMLLAWSVGTPAAGITTGLVTFPDFKDEADFKKWLPSVKGQFVLVSEPEATGRPDYNWEEFATKESFEKMKEERTAAGKKWNENIEKTGLPTRSRDGAKTLYDAIEEAGAAGIISSRWSNGFGVNKVFSTLTKKIPSFDVGMEDYGLIYRLTINGSKPKVRIKADAKFNGAVPNQNTISEIKGNKKADQYVMMSAHFDSWDGASGATDNGTGSLVMMEAMRILKKVYPKPNRTLMTGLWASEEQGLNGSGAFVEDHPDIVENLQALFNQDNGTGRVVNISGSGFTKSSEFLGRWLQQVPSEITDGIKTNFPGTPSGGGTDHASFVIAGAPGFSLSSLNWSYWNYTWHTNRDTYDKLVWDDLVNNVILTASLVYLASEDPEFFPRDRREVLPVSSRTGEPMTWPSKREPDRKGRLDK